MLDSMPRNGWRAVEQNPNFQKLSFFTYKLRNSFMRKNVNCFSRILLMIPKKCWVEKYKARNSTDRTLWDL
jgi:hypothetical protein